MISSPVYGNAPLRRHIQSAKQIQQRGFSGAARPHESHEIALIHIQIEPLQHLNLFTAAAVRLRKPAHLNQTLPVPLAIHSNHLRSSYFSVATF